MRRSLLWLGLVWVIAAGCVWWLAQGSPHGTEVGPRVQGTETEDLPLETARASETREAVAAPGPAEPLPEDEPEADPVTEDVEIVLLDHAGVLVRTARVDVYRQEGVGDAYVGFRNPPHTGELGLPGLTAGRYRVTTRSARHFPGEFDFEVGPGRDNRVVCKLTSIPTAGSISGRLTGLEDYSEVAVWLLSYEYVDARFKAELTTVGQVAEFEFNDVPVGEYVVSVVDDVFRPWAPGSALVRAPASDVVFSCGSSEVRRVFVMALDEDTAEPVGARWLVYSDRNGLLLEGSAMRGRDLFGIEVGGPFRWFLRAEGYKMAYGDERDLVQGEKGPWIQASLSHRGWCEVVRVQTPSEASLSGVSVLVDGTLAGVTGQEGIVLVERSQAPKTIGLRLDGYRVAEYSGINADGAYEVWEWEIVGVLERAD